MRLVSFITQSSVIDQILTPLRTRASTAVHTGARSPPPPGPRRPRAPRADRPRHTVGPEHRPRTPRQRAGRSACAVAHPPVFARSTITPDTQSTAIEIPLPSRHVVAGSRDTGAAAGRRRLRTAGAGPAVYRHEGKLVAIVALEAADAVLAAMHAHPLGRSGARALGRVYRPRQRSPALLRADDYGLRRPPGGGLVEWRAAAAHLLSPHSAPTPIQSSTS